MLALLFGSYSIPITFAGIPSFFLLKSTILYFFLAPPPRCLTVILPCALRPAFLFLESRRDFSGVVFVISEKSEPVICLLEGVYGLYVLIPITVSPFVCSNYSFHGIAPYIRLMKTAVKRISKDCRAREARPFALISGLLTRREAFH